MTGLADTVLVVLRGNSGSGKSKVAQGLRRRLGRGVAWVEQDHLRRIVLREHDLPGLPNIGLIDTVARYALDAGYHVIVEGILRADHYGDMLRHLTTDHVGQTFHYYLDIPLPETLRRHATKPLAAEVNADQVASWYRAGDVLGLPDETIIGPDATADEIIARILTEVDFPEPPVRLSRQLTEHRPAGHLPTGHAEHLPTGHAGHFPTGHAEHLPTGHAGHFPTGHAE